MDNLITKLSYRTTKSDSNDNNLTTICDVHVDSKYYEMEDMQHIPPKNIKPKLTALHINIHSLPAKFYQLNLLLYKLKQANTYAHCILLCETFVNDNNSARFPIPGYNCICKNRQNATRGGIAIYIREETSHTVRDDLAVHIESELESLCRVPNTNEQLSIELYETLISKVNCLKIDTLLATDQNFDLLKIDKHKNTSHSFNLFTSPGFIPTITRPTRITHTSCTY